MGTSITIDDGKFAVYRAADAAGGSPVTEIIAVTDGGAGVVKDSTGKLWVFRIYDGKLEYKRSTDTSGDTYGAWTEIIGSGIADGIPGACAYPTGIIEVNYYKDDDKFYRSITKNFGTTWEAEEEITT